MKNVIIDATARSESELLKAMIEAYTETKGHFKVLLADATVAHVDAFEYTPNHENCEWFFVGNTVFPYADDDSLAKIARFFANFTDELKKRDEDIERLRMYEADLAKMDKESEEYRETFGFYSDFHKDIYGHRPGRRP